MIDETTILSETNLALVDELRDIRETTKKLKAREDEIRSTLLTKLKGVEYGLTASGQPAIEIQRQTRYRTDNKRLQALYEDAWKDCQIETVVEVLRLPETVIEDIPVLD